MIYINSKDRQGNVETIDEFPNDSEAERIYAREMLQEYRMAHHDGSLYFSQRCTREWGKS